MPSCYKAYFWFCDEGSLLLGLRVPGKVPRIEPMLAACKICLYCNSTYCTISPPPLLDLYKISGKTKKAYSITGNLIIRNSLITHFVSQIKGDLLAQ